MAYDIMEAEREIQESAERLAAAEGYDWYAVPTWESTPEAWESIKVRLRYRQRAAAEVILSLPDDHPWKLAAR